LIIELPADREDWQAAHDAHDVIVPHDQYGAIKTNLPVRGTPSEGDGALRAI